MLKSMHCTVVCSLLLLFVTCNVFVVDVVVVVVFSLLLPLIFSPASCQLALFDAETNFLSNSMNICAGI